MGSCCSQPSAAQRYVVPDEENGNNAPAAVHNVAPRPPDSHQPSMASGAEVAKGPPPAGSTRSTGSLVHHSLTQPNPVVDALSGDVLQAVVKKENAYRAKVLAEEFKTRSELRTAGAWMADRISDAVNTSLRLRDECALLRASWEDVDWRTDDPTTVQPTGDGGAGSAAGNVGSSRYVSRSPTDLRASVVVEEFIIAPAAFQSRTLLSESGGGASLGMPSSSSMDSIALPRIASRASVSSPSHSIGRYSSPPPAVNMLDELLNMDDRTSLRPYMTPPPRLEFECAPLVVADATSPVYQWGRLDPFDDDVRMDVIPYLVMQPAADERLLFRRSLVRELNSDHRSPIVEGDAFVCFALDEVDDRDRIARYAHHASTELLLQETQEGGIRWHLEYGRHLLRCRQACFMLWLWRLEHHQRMVMEHDAFKALVAMWTSTDRRMTMRRTFERQQAETKARAMQRAEAVVRDHAAQSAQRRKVDRLKWEVERSRLKKPTPTAKEMLMAQLAAAAAAEPPEAAVAARVAANRLQVRHAAHVEALEVEEARWRGATVAEEHRRWEVLVDTVVRHAPELLSASSALDGILTVRQRMELIAAQQTLERLQRRIDGNTIVDAALPDRGAPCDGIDRLVAELTILRHAEQKSRKVQEYQETLYRAMIADVCSEEYDIHAAHDERRAAAQRAEDAVLDAERRRTSAIALLNRTGRGFQWRRRIGAVFPIGEDIKFLVEEHRRSVKHSAMMENIVRGDLIHLFALECRMQFPNRASSMVRDSDMYLWTTDCLPNVEKMFREAVEARWLQALMDDVWAPFAEERAVVAKIPKAVSEGRVAAARSIQHAYRCFRNRRWFEVHMKDAMVLRYEKRRALHAAIRLLTDKETSERSDIAASWAATDWAALKRDVFVQSARHWAAATRIASTFKGWWTRTHTMPPRLEQALVKRLRRLEEQEQCRRTGGVERSDR